VYNSPRYLRRCLNSIFNSTNEDFFNIILVDDQSDQFTKETISEFQENHKDIIEVISNKTNLGYVKSANAGIRKSVSENVVLVNSDVLVTNGWLKKFESALINDPSIGLISPLSNNAANLTIKMPPGYDYLSMNDFVEKNSRKIYPDAMTILGHCLLITRKVIEKIGVFDEIYSPAYTEETDYHFQVIKNGFRAVIADDTYVFHKGEGSIKNRSELFQDHIKIFNERWGQEFKKLLVEYNHKDELGYLRDQKTLLPIIEKLPPPKFDVVFFLPGLAGGIGGIVTVVEIVNGLILQGIKANIAYIGRKMIDIDLFFEPIPYENIDEFLTFPPETKVLVATEYGTVKAVEEIGDKYKIKTCYFIQDYEGWFDPIHLLEPVKLSYKRIKEKIVVSNWLKKILKEQDDSESTVLNVGVATDEFYPRNKLSDEISKLREKSKLLVLHLLSTNDRRGSIYFIQAMRELIDETEDIGFVVTQRTQDLFRDTINDRVVNLGMLHRNKIPEYFSQCDVLVDSSLFHGFGLPGLEAMSCGLGTILTDVEIDYAENEKNCYLVPPKDVAGIKKTLLKLRENPTLLAEIRNKGIDTAKNFDWENLYPKYKNYFQKFIDQYKISEKRPKFRYHELLSYKNLREAIEQKEISPQPANYNRNIATPNEIIKILRFYIKQHGLRQAFRDGMKWIFK